MGRDQEMGRVVYGGDRGVGYALSTQIVRTLNRRMTGSAPQHQRRGLDGRKQSTREAEAIGTCPIQDVYRCGFHGVVANALRPAGEGARAAVEVDHLFDR